MRDLSHRCLRRALSGYADRELDAPTAATVAAHLPECARCRRELAVVMAIKGSLRRLGAAEPPAVAAARPGRHRARTLAGALAAIVAVVAAISALRSPTRGPSPDASPVAAMVELARLLPLTPPDTHRGGPLGKGSAWLELADQKVWLARHLVDGQEVLVATSDRTFQMPADANRLGREAGTPWRVTRGDVSVACVSRPAHRLVVGHLPAERLLEIGRQLGPA